MTSQQSAEGEADDVLVAQLVEQWLNAMVDGSSPSGHYMLKASRFEAFKLKHTEFCQYCDFSSKSLWGIYQHVSKSHRDEDTFKDTFNLMKAQLIASGRLKPKIRKNILRKQAGAFSIKGVCRGIRCDSSWEAAVVVWMKDHRYKIERCYDSIEYLIDGIKHLYYPDFISGNRLIEVKGYTIPKDLVKWEAAKSQGFNLIVIDSQSFFKFIHPYLEKTYGCKRGSYREFMTECSKPLTPTNQRLKEIRDQRSLVMTHLGIQSVRRYASFLRAVKDSCLSVNDYLREILIAYSDVVSRASKSSTSVVSDVSLRRAKRELKLGKRLYIRSIDPELIEDFMVNFPDLNRLPSVKEVDSHFKHGSRVQIAAGALIKVEPL